MESPAPPPPPKKNLGSARHKHGFEWVLTAPFATEVGLKTVSALEPTTQTSVKNGFSSFFLHNTSNIFYVEKWSWANSLLYIFSAIVWIGTSKSHKINNLNNKFECYLRVAQNSHIKSNSLRFAELGPISFYFTFNLRQLNFSKSKKSYILSWNLQNTPPKFSLM